MNKKLLTLSAAIISFATLAQAATIVPISYTHATGAAAPEGNAGDDTTSPSRMTDNVISTGSWSDGTNVSWGTGGVTGPTDPQAGMTFIFDQVYDFTTVDIYQNEGGGWGATDYRISTSTDNSDFSNTTGIVALTGGTNVGGTASTVLYTLDVSALADAQYVQVELFDANQWIMLSEVDFAGSPVPEPSSFALLAGMFGLTSVMLRRRRA